MVAAREMLTRLDEVIAVKTFSLASAILFTCIAAIFIASGLTGMAPIGGIEKTLSIPSHNTVAVDSGDLNQLDITSKPASKFYSDAPRLVEIEDAVAGLHTQTPQGLVPVIRKDDGLTPFKAYAASFSADPASKAVVSFVMTDFGLSEKASNTAIKNLPPGVSMVLDAYTRHAQEWTSQARRHGHEVWLSLPLQSKDYPTVDTGPKTVLANMEDKEANNRLLQTLGIATGYSGVVVANSSGFTKAGALLEKILADIAGRGLGIVQSDKSDRMLPDIAASTRAPFAFADLNIDMMDPGKNLQEKFIDIETQAIQKKKLVVFFSPYPATIKALENWSKKASGRGIQLAPLSAVVSK